MKTFKLLLVLLLSLLLLGQEVSAQNALKMKLLSNFGKGEGESIAVFAAGSLVFYGVGNKVQISSFSNPMSPVKIASVEVPDIIQDLVRTSIGGTQYLVVSAGRTVSLINVQDPTKPSTSATIDIGVSTTCEGVATSGSYAYIAAGGAGFKVYNIATPSSPTLVASMDSLAYCESVVISGQYAYIAAGTRSHIVDITNPSSPVYVSGMYAYGGGNYHQYLNVRSGYAYICDYNAGLAIVNVSNPANPVNVMALPLAFRTQRIVFDGNYAYVAAGDSGMYIFNVTNPAAPAKLSRIQTTGRAASLYYGAISISGTPTGHIFVANRNPGPGMSAINVSNPSAPTTSAFVASLSAATGIAYTPYYSSGKVYIAYGTAGLRIVDVTNPSGATLLSTTALGGDSRGVVVSGNYAYVAARDSGVFVVDATNPASPVKLNTIKTPRARGIAINGNYVYVAASDSGLGIINITDPKNPVLVGYSHPGSQYGENVAAAGNVIGLTDYGKILFFDATTPAAPVGKGTTASFKTGNEGFAIAGTYAYVPDGDSMKVFNITNLSAPTQVAKIFTGGYGYTAAVAGKYCYVASEATGVRTIDISNPAAPVEAGYYDGIPQSRGVVANGVYVYVAEKADGLTVYSNDLISSVERQGFAAPETFSLGQNFPNPFNPRTSFEFQVASFEFVSLKVFDLLGREIAVLVNEEQAPGIYRLTWDASDLPSGVYLYRLQAGNFVETRKMTLVK